MEISIVYMKSVDLLPVATWSLVSRIDFMTIIVVTLCAKGLFFFRCLSQSLEMSTIKLGTR